MITLLSAALSSHATDVKPKTTPYKQVNTVLEELKENATVSGPFLLNIQAITEAQHKTYLHTQKDPTATNNMILEMPIYIKNHYLKNYKSDLNNLFLNQNLIVKGLAKMQTHSLSDQSQSEVKAPTIKIIFTDQLSHYD